MSTDDTHAGNDADAAAEQPAAQKRRKPGTFDSERAREMAQRSHAKRKARQAAAETVHAVDDGDVRTTVVPVRVAVIIRAYEKEAARGNANAGRELRAWLNEYPPRDDAISAADLDRQTRQRLMARLLAELEEESPAQD